MRAQALLVAFLFAAGAFAGCVNTEKDPEVTPGSVSDPATDPTSGVTSPTTLQVLAPLPLNVQTAASAWVAPGSSIPLAASAPENAVGDVTYTWAIGAVPGTVAVDVAGLDTGSGDASEYIQPGESATLTFDTTGVFEMHCHPHPWMRSNVTVVDGVESPATVTVQIIDGEKPGVYRYVPENILVAPGTQVVYENLGAQPHTATLMSATPSLTKLALTGMAGDVTVTGEGWQRILVVAIDSEGRFGSASHDVYVKDLPTFDKIDLAAEFSVGGASDEAQAPFTRSFVTTHGGMLFFNFTARDPAAQNGAPANSALVEVHIAEQGATQDTLTVDDKAEGEENARVQAKTYTLKVIPKQGVSIEFIGTIEVVYELVPPALDAGAEESGDGHDHQH